MNFCLTEFNTKSITKKNLNFCLTDFNAKYIKKNCTSTIHFAVRYIYPCVIKSRDPKSNPARQIILV